jgi:hypothetical protein
MLTLAQNGITEKSKRASPPRKMVGISRLEIISRRGVALPLKEFQQYASAKLPIECGQRNWSANQYAAGPAMGYLPCPSARPAVPLKRVGRKSKSEIFLRKAGEVATSAQELGSAMLAIRRGRLPDGTSIPVPEWSRVASTFDDMFEKQVKRFSDTFPLLIPHIKAIGRLVNKVGAILRKCQSHEALWLGSDFYTAGTNLSDAIKEYPQHEPMLVSWADDETAAPSSSELPVGGWAGGSGPPSKRSQKRGGKKPLEESNPRKFQIYQRIQREHEPGTEYVDLVDRLKADRDFVDQVRAAGLKLDTALVRRALVFFDQRNRDAARKKQETRKP